MRILFVLSQIEVTGAETYAVALAKALRERGHEITFVSEKLRDPAGFEFISLPLHTWNTSTLGRVRNVFSLKQIIREKKIEVIHAHARAANLVCHFAKGPVPMVVTVHGRWRNHFAARTLPCLGERTIAVCPYLARYLSEDIHVPSARVRMVPNGITLSEFVCAPLLKGAPEILFVGRFSGQKGNVIRHLLRAVYPGLAREFPSVTFKIVSYAPPQKDLDTVSRLNADLGREAVKVVDWGASTAELYAGAFAVVGSGRVVMEAMASARPAVCIGESSAPGLLTPENFNQAFDSNFGDTGEWNLFEQGNTVQQDLKTLITNPARAAELGAWGRKKAEEVFNAGTIAVEVENVYFELFKKSA